MQLDTALDTARQHTSAASGTEAKMARLREAAPDLADGEISRYPT
jgi:hypothetical protein